jgi:hypothetical protein
LTGGSAVHQAAYVQSSDPGTVGAYKFWVDTSTATPYQLKQRNAANAAWINIGVRDSLSDPTTTRGDIIRRDASALVRLAIGSSGTFLRSDGTDPSWSNTAAHFAASGLTGAVAPSRYVGATTGGAPVTGTFAVGDFAIDHAGKFWVCTGAGSPGTWTQSSGNMTNPMTANQDVIVGAAAGLPARLGVGANGQVLTVSAGVVSWQNSAAGFSNPMTLPGDMIHGTTAGAPARLAIGANNQILRVVGGLPGWSNESGGSGGVSTTNAANVYLARNFI